MAKVQPSRADEQAPASDDIHSSGSWRSADLSQWVGQAYQHRPLLETLEPILQIVREQGQPERARELTWTKPDKAHNFQIVSPKITVSRALRPHGDYICCPFCSPVKPKFLSFFLLWSENDKLVRIIGHECAETYFGTEKFRTMEIEADALATKERNEIFLLQRLADIPQYLADIDNLIPTARKVTLVQRLFANRAPALWRTLKAFQRERGGTLGYDRLISANGPAGIRSSTGGASIYEFVPVSTIRGFAFLVVKDLATQLADIHTSLAWIIRDSRSPLDENEVLETVVRLDDEQARAVQAIESAHRSVTRIVDRLEDMISFLADANLASLDSWGRHEQNPAPFSARPTPNAAIFGVGPGEYVSVPRDGLTVIRPKRLGVGS